MRIIANDDYRTNINSDYYSISMIHVGDIWKLVARNIFDTTDTVDLVISKDKDYVEEKRINLQHSFVCKSLIHVM